MPETVKELRLGDVPLQSGSSLRDARIVYATHGRLSADKDNVVLLPTYYGGTHEDNARIVRRGRALDPDRFFVVIPTLFGTASLRHRATTPSIRARTFLL